MRVLSEKVKSVKFGYLYLAKKLHKFNLKDINSEKTGLG